MNTETILTRLVAIAPQAINQICKPGQPHCVMATTIGQMVLAKLGIDAEPYVAEIHVCNKAWMQWADDEFAGGRDAQLRRGAYLMCNSPDWKGASFQSVKVDKPWDGHLVLRVPDGDIAWLVDLDLGSFNRPKANVVLPPGLMAKLNNDTVVGTFVKDGSETAVAYRRLVAPYRDDYQTARDWVERDRLNDVVEKLVAAVKRPYSLKP